MLKVGGGGIRYNRARKFLDPAHFSLKPRPFGVDNAARPPWQEFLGCSNKEMNGRTDSVATYSWNFIWYLIVRPITARTGIALAVGALPPFLVGWGGTYPRFLRLCYKLSVQTVQFVRLFHWASVLGKKEDWYDIVFAFETTSLRVFWFDALVLYGSFVEKQWEH